MYQCFGINRLKINGLEYSIITILFLITYLFILPYIYIQVQTIQAYLDSSLLKPSSATRFNSDLELSRRFFLS